MTPWVQVWILKVTFPTVAFSNAVLFQKRYQDVWLPEHSKSFKYRYIILSGQNLCSMFRHIAFYVLCLGAMLSQPSRPSTDERNYALNPELKDSTTCFSWAQPNFARCPRPAQCLKTLARTLACCSTGPVPELIISMFRKFKPVPLVSLISSRQNCNFTKDFTFISSQHVSTSSALFTWCFW